MSNASVGSEEETGPPRSGNGFLGDVWVNFKRWNRKAIRSPFVLVVALAQPILALLLFTEVFDAVGAAALAQSRFASVSYVTFLLPAVVVQASLASAISSGVTLYGDVESGMFDKVLVTPMSWPAVFAGKAAAELVRIVLQVLLVLGLSVALGARVETGLIGVAGVVLVCVLFAAWFMAVSNTIALVTRSEEAITAVANLLQFPLLFLSSGLLPLEAFPGWVQAVAVVNPVTYAIDAVRALVLGREASSVLAVSRFGGMYETVVPSVLVLLALNVAFGGVTVALLRRASRGTVD